MLRTDELTLSIDHYLNDCRTRHRKPTFKGIGAAIGTSDMTVRNVFLGKYNGRHYGDKPSYNRRIDNPDFDLIRNAMKGAYQDD
ncbi:hypothetical protein [Butyrivibrio sp. AE3004]|uniref:hypothetical protein n=1 Tax=Butyrivibrio sp. AE3004 TaxID=1506994 RepID=UPI000494D86D|nr:hypothetical protein [Butyrivibrio sp. AE3004]